MRWFALLALSLSSCGSNETQDVKGASPRPSPAITAGGAPRATKAMTLPIPEEAAQLQRLVSMGYKIHEDHLDPPGVATCPKMSDNPVM